MTVSIVTVSIVTVHIVTVSTFINQLPSYLLVSILQDLSYTHVRFAQWCSSPCQTLLYHTLMFEGIKDFFRILQTSSSVTLKYIITFYVLHVGFIEVDNYRDPVGR